MSGSARRSVCACTRATSTPGSHWITAPACRRGQTAAKSRRPETASESTSISRRSATPSSTSRHREEIGVTEVPRERRGRRARSADAPAPPPPEKRSLRYRSLENPFPPLEILSADQVAHLHASALTVLEEDGIRVLLPEARDVFRAAGA